MSRPTQRDLATALLRRHGRTFASEAGIRLDRNTPSPLFQLLCMSLLISARISADIAVAASKALTKAGWTTPPKMADATWAQRTRVLNQAGYARYDESTSRYLEATSRILIDEYDGDLRNLRAAADGDIEAARKRLKEFKGIGEVGADIFLREVQGVWDEYAPFMDDRTTRAAESLGLPGSAARLHRLVDGEDEFVRLVAALVRTDLAGDQDEIRTIAAER